MSLIHPTSSSSSSAYSISDAFGATQGYHLGTSLTGENIDPLARTWSGIQANPSFQNGSMPMPIFVSRNSSMYWDISCWNLG